MRFLLGLMIGAAVVLLLAGSLTGRGDWKGQLTTLAGGLEAMVRGDDGPVDDEMETLPIPAAALSPVGEPALEPIPRPPDPRPVDTPISEDRETLVAREGVEEPEQLENAERVVINQMEPELETEPETQTEPETLTEPEQKSQTVWVPFHSERSASGFAERLTASLDHPFRVERRGPGRYQVVFAYADEPQRQALLTQAAETMGLPL
jgi:hypothetical protein